jgi:hypothetical protein
VTPRARSVHDVGDVLQPAARSLGAPFGRAVHTGHHAQIHQVIRRSIQHGMPAPLGRSRRRPFTPSPVRGWEKRAPGTRLFVSDTLVTDDWQRHCANAQTDSDGSPEALQAEDVGSKTARAPPGCKRGSRATRRCRRRSRRICRGVPEPGPRRGARGRAPGPNAVAIVTGAGLVRGVSVARTHDRGRAVSVSHRRRGDEHCLRSRSRPVRSAGSYVVPARTRSRRGCLRASGRVS